MTEEKKVVDFSQFDVLTQNQEAGTEMPVRHPTTSVPLGPKMTVVSAESIKVRDLQRELVDRRVREQRRVVTAQDNDDELLELTAGMVVGWSGIVLDGEELEFSQPNVIRFLRRFRWVRDQIDNHASTRANFLKS